MTWKGVEADCCRYFGHGFPLDLFLQNRHVCMDGLIVYIIVEGLMVVSILFMFRFMSCLEEIHTLPPR